jgi:hypothetical protein
MSIATEKIIEDAEVAALYLRQLLEKGVPMMAAVSLTQSYASARQITDSQKDKPREPWEENPGA